MVMSFRRQFEQGYTSFWRRLANFMRNSSGFPLSGVAHRGSRSTGQHKDKSDLDVIFAISGDPPKGEVYPLLVERLKKTLKVNADIGSRISLIIFGILNHILFITNF
jgi:hypothetical protein